MERRVRVDNLRRYWVDKFYPERERKDRKKATIIDWFIPMRESRVESTDPKTRALRTAAVRGAAAEKCVIIFFSVQSNQIATVSWGANCLLFFDWTHHHRQRGTAKKRMSIEYFCNCVYFGIIFCCWYFRGPAREKNRRNILIGTTSNCFPLSRWSRTAQNTKISAERTWKMWYSIRRATSKSIDHRTICRNKRLRNSSLLSQYAHFSSSMCCEPNSVSFQLTRVSFRLICFT